MSKLQDNFGDFLDDLDNLEKLGDDETLSELVKTQADALVKDIRSLPKPKSSRNGITHLLDGVTYTEGKAPNWVIGWGHYYGPMVEGGTKRQKGHGATPAQPHMMATYERNRDKYIRLAQEKFNQMMEG